MHAAASGHPLQAAPKAALPPPALAARMGTTTSAGQVTVPAWVSTAKRSLGKRPPGRWLTATACETTAKTYQQERAGRPGPATRYREITTTHFALTHDIKLETISYDDASDGTFPLITNDRFLTDAQVLAAYRYQPNLERRHHLLKSVQDAAPVLLHNPARIEALFCC